jgi:hypothetical protein
MVFDNAVVDGTVPECPTCSEAIPVTFEALKVNLALKESLTALQALHLNLARVTAEVEEAQRGREVAVAAAAADFPPPFPPFLLFFTGGCWASGGGTAAAVAVAGSVPLLPPTAAAETRVAPRELPLPLPPSPVAL